MNILRWFDDLGKGLSVLLPRTARHYCRLATPVNDTTFAANDGSLVTMLQFDGMLEMVGPEDLSAMMNRLTRDLDAYMEKSGHTIQVVMNYDPELSRVETDNALNAAKLTARNNELDADFVFDEWSKAISDYCASEGVWFVLWTHPHILPRSEIGPAQKRQFRRVNEQPKGRGTQRLGLGIQEIEDRHKAFTKSLETSLQECKALARILSGQEMLSVMRYLIDPEMGSKHWEARLPGDGPPPQFMPEREDMRPDDFSHVLYPDIGSQLFAREGESLDNRFYRQGDRIYHPLTMSMPPKEPSPFNVFFRRLLNLKKIPWRVSFLLQGDGIAGLTYKQVLGMLFQVTSRVSRNLYQTIETLKELQSHGSTIVKLQITFMTWAPYDNDDASLGLLRERSATLVSAIQSWGSCDVNEVSGDPQIGFAAMIPGMMPRSPANPVAAPLSDAVGMLPLTRPVSVWDQASVLLRSPDGKLLPYLQGSSRQAAWIDIGVAPMGGGKSVWLNAQNFAFCTIPGLVRIPLVSNIDIGPSSKGVVDLLRSVLPKEKQHYAVYERLRLEERFATNPCDTPLGCRFPVPMHKSFLVNFCSLLCSPLEADAAPNDNIPALALKCINLAYKLLSDDRSPRGYSVGTNEEIDRVLEGMDFKFDKITSWWEIVDALYEAGYLHEAGLAQRYAVPLLSEIAAHAKDNEFTSSYGEELCNTFWRKIVDAIEAYPIIGGVTRFDLSEARVISLDLDEVAPRGSATSNRQTAVMYMLARHICASRFFLMPDDVLTMPALYRNYHAERIDAIRVDPKRWNMDEFHRVSKNAAISKQIVGDIEVAVRESRKWNLHIGLYTQNYADIPQDIIELATSIYLIGAGTRKNVIEMGERFALSSFAQNALEYLHQPDRRGASMIAIQRTNRGRSVQQVTNTLSPVLIWAFSTTTEDEALRSRLSAAIGLKEALSILAKVFPGGAKSTVEKRRQENAESGEKTDVIADIVEEMKALHYEHMMKSSDVGS